MRLRTADHRKTFNASIPTDHPASVPGPIALKRQDTGEWISLGDCFGVPGCKFRLKLSERKRTRRYVPRFHTGWCGCDA